MWNYQKRLQYPINIKNPNPKLAAFIVSQYGGAYCKKIQKSEVVPRLLLFINQLIISPVKR